MKKFDIADKHSSITWRTDKPRSLWGDALRTFSKNKAGMVGLFLILVFFSGAIFAPWISKWDPNEQNWDALREGPSLLHIMGTDELGRDVFTRILYGSRTAILVGIVTTSISSLVGIIVGTTATYLRGWFDAIAVWVMDALMNFPVIWFAAFISVATRPTIRSWSDEIYKISNLSIFKDPVIIDYLVVFSCLSLVSWPGIGRLVRGQVLALREREFIVALRSIGVSPWRISSRHLIPNVLGSVIVAMSSNFGAAMLAESSLSFLGIGIRPPSASLGNMIASSMMVWRTSPHLVLMPGLVLSIAMLGFNFIGDGLNDALNPSARKR